MAGSKSIFVWRKFVVVKIKLKIISGYTGVSIGGNFISCYLSTTPCPPPFMLCPKKLLSVSASKYLPEHESISISNIR